MEVAIVLALTYGVVAYYLSQLYYSQSAWSLALLVVLIFGYARSYYDGAEHSGKRRWDVFHRAVAHLSQVVARHCFSYRIEYAKAATSTAETTTTQWPIVYAAQPHGLFALASFFHVMQADAPWAAVRPFTHRHIFALPLLREVALWLGAMDATEQNIRTALRNGDSVYVVIDGARGMMPLDNDDGRDGKRHEGLLRLAYDTQTPVCPVVHRGHQDVFTNHTPTQFNAVRQFLMDLVGYPFPTVWTMRRAGLSTQLLDPLEPTQFVGSVDEFIDCYYERVKRSQALDHIAK